MMTAAARTWWHGRRRRLGLGAAVDATAADDKVR